MRWDDPADDPDYIGRTRAIVADLAPWVGRGVYVNMLNFDEQDRVVEALGGPEKYAELGRVKARVRPAEPVPDELQHPPGARLGTAINPGRPPCRPGLHTPARGYSLVRTAIW